MRQLQLPEISEQVVANALDAFVTMLESQMEDGKENGYRSREYERLLVLIRGDGEQRGIAAQLAPARVFDPMWERIVVPRRPRSECTCGTDQDKEGPCETFTNGDPLGVECVLCKHVPYCHPVNVDHVEFPDDFPIG